MVIAVGSRSVVPGREAEWEALWAQMVELARAQPGFRSARLLRSKEHNGKYTVLSEWESERSWDRYYALPSMQELTQRSFALFSAAPVQEWHVVVSDVRAEG
jgi:heme-degrading monooxygenase HmoA